MVTLNAISQHDLTASERESVLAHAVELHLLGSDEADHEGFDIAEEKGSNVTHLLRITRDGQPAGIMYLLPFADLPGHYEMTILIHPEFRGRHLTAEAVSLLENFVRTSVAGARGLCATVREHNPLRAELTEFLLRHGYRYVPQQLAFIKTL